MLFDYTMNKYADGLSLMDLIHVKDIMEKIPKLYVPSFETYDNGTTFISNGDTVIVQETGAMKVRFLLFDKNGKLITEPDTSYTQFHPKRVKYLARLSCPFIGVSGPNLTLDYIVDINNIRLLPVSSMYGKKKETKDNSNVTEIIEDYQYNFIPIDPGTEIDDLIKNFDMNREEIIDQFFK